MYFVYSVVIAMPLPTPSKAKLRTALRGRPDSGFPDSELEFFAKHVHVRCGSQGWRLWTLEGHEFMALLVVDDTRQTVMQKSTQLGISTLEIGKALYRCCRLRLVGGYYITNANFVRKFVSSTVDPVIDKDPLIAQFVVEGDPYADLSEWARKRKKGADTTQLKRFGDIPLWFLGVQTYQDVSSVDMDHIGLDEFDELDEALAEDIPDRIMHSDYKRRSVFCKPSVPDFGINAEYLASDQKRFMLRCANCGKWTNLEDAFPACLFPREQRGHHTNSSVRIGVPFGAGSSFRFGCPLCGGGRLPSLEGPRTVRFHQTRRDGLPARQPSILDASGRICARWEAAFPDRPISGYRISQMYGPFTSADDVAADWKKSEKSDVARGRFTRSVGGQPYAADRQPITAAVFDAACNPSVRRLLHQEPALLRTAVAIWAGIDLGKTHWLWVLAEFPDGLIQTVWFEECHDDDVLADRLRRFGVHAFCIDAGAETHTAKRLVKQFPHRGVLTRWSDTQLQGVVGEEIDGLDVFHTLKVPRTESLDEMCSLIRREGDDGPRLRLPNVLCEEMDVARRHFLKLVKKDKDEDARQPYRDGVENHLACACCYATLIRKWGENLHVGPVADLTGLKLSIPRTPLPSPWGD